MREKMKIKQLCANKKKILLIFSLILLGLAAAALIIFFYQHTHNKDISATTVDSEFISSQASYMVKFYDVNGALLKTETVASGSRATPPKGKPAGSDYVFLSWNKTLGFIRGDTEVRPSVKYINGYTNVIYSNAVYAGNGEIIKPQIMLGGNPEINLLKVSVYYNPIMLEFIEVECNSKQVKASTDIKKQMISLTLSSKEKITQEMVLSTISFKVINDHFKYTQLKVVVDEASVSGDNGQYKNADYVAINGKTFVY